MFPNLRSAVISIAVVVVLIIFAVVAIDRSNVNRLGRYEKQALAELKNVESHLALRQDYATTLCAMLEQKGHAAELAGLIALAKHDRTYAPYFEKMYEEELLLAEALLSYHAKAEYFNRQKHAFPAVLVANRLEMEDLPIFTVSAALKGRP